MAAMPMQPVPFPAKSPKHVAIIMDGNGRWASHRGLPRSVGHKAGVEALRRAVKAAGNFGIEYLTIYAFSSENWSRPPAEVSFLFDLLRRFIRQDVAELHRENVKVSVVGQREDLEPGLRRMLEDAEQLTRGNTKLNLVVAFNYGARQELARAVRRMALKIEQGELKSSDVSADLVAAHLDTAHIPDPDLLIRTGGEQRISNFLLWQCAYTEFVFLDEFWPEFSEEIFARAIADYHARDRRFGGLQAQTA
jgi:undecaprenyl diphosphate synthase